MEKMKEVLEGVYSDPELRKKVVPLFIGNPGLGKTVIIDQFAKEKGVKLIEIITSQAPPFEVSGIAMPDKETKRMTYFNYDNLEDLQDGDIIFFDELLNGNPVTLNACLTLLEQRKMVSGKRLPDVMIVAAANPQGAAPTTPQIKERFVWYDVTFSAPMWKAYMEKKYMMPAKIISKLSHLIKSEKFDGNNFMTPRSVDKAVAMLIAGVPTPYAKIIEPILETLVENKLEEAVDLPDGRKVEPGETVPWLNLFRIPKVEAKEDISDEDESDIGIIRGDYTSGI